MGGAQGFPWEVLSGSPEFDGLGAVRLTTEVTKARLRQFQSLISSTYESETSLENIDASIAATLYTLDEAIRTLAKKNPMFKCTVVVLMGKVNEPKSNSEQDALLATDERTSKNFDEPMKKKAFYVHTNFQFVQRLVGIVSQNYPERLGQAIVVPSGGWEKLIGAHGLRRYVQSSKTRSKITVVDNVNDLKNYISMEQLIDIAGGESQTAFVGM
jgi:hypothetical protein